MHRYVLPKSIAAADAAHAAKTGTDAVDMAGGEPVRLQMLLQEGDPMYDPRVGVQGVDLLVLCGSRSGKNLGFPWVLCKRSRYLTTFTPALPSI